MGHLAAGHKSKAGTIRQVQKLFEPAARDLLNHTGSGSHGEQGSVLIPCGGEPVGRERAGQAASHDPAKETRAVNLVEAALNSAHKVLDNNGRGRAALGQRTVKLGEKAGATRRGRNRSEILTGAEPQGVFQGHLKGIVGGRVFVGHAQMLPDPQENRLLDCQRI